MSVFDRATEGLSEDRRAELRGVLGRLGMSLDDPMVIGLGIAGYAQKSEAALSAMLNAAPANVESWKDEIREVLNDDAWVDQLTDAAGRAGRIQARHYALGYIAAWTAALAAITVALWFGLGAYWSGVYEERMKAEVRSLAKTYDTTPDLITWAAQFKSADRHPVVTERMLFAAGNPEAIAWVRSQRGGRMRLIDKMYSGSKSGEYPCLALDDREFRVGNDRLATCLIAIGWE